MNYRVEWNMVNLFSNWTNIRRLQRLVIYPLVLPCFWAFSFKWIFMEFSSFSIILSSTSIPFFKVIMILGCKFFLILNISFLLWINISLKKANKSFPRNSNFEKFLGTLGAFVSPKGMTKILVMHFCVYLHDPSSLDDNRPSSQFLKK